jgi:hypothetical protein
MSKNLLAQCTSFTKALMIKQDRWSYILRLQKREWNKPDCACTFKRHSLNLPEKNNSRGGFIGLGSSGWSNTLIDNTSRHYAKPTQSQYTGLTREIKSAEVKINNAVLTMQMNLIRSRKCTICASSVRKPGTGCENVTRHIMDVKAPTANCAMITLGFIGNDASSLRGRWVNAGKINASMRRTLNCPTNDGLGMPLM